MGSSYSPKTPPKVKGNRNVSKKLWDESVKNSLLVIAYKLFRNVQNAQHPIFPKKKIETPKIGDRNNDAVHHNCLPEQRSLARKMGSSYSPKTPPTKKGLRNVRIKLGKETIEIALLHIAYNFVGNVFHLDR
jgi:hypothetical protein